MKTPKRMTKNIFDARQEIADELKRQGGFIFVGRIAEIVRKYHLKPEQAKPLLDWLGLSTRDRGFIYDQIRLSQKKVRKVL